MVKEVEKQVYLFNEEKDDLKVFDGDPYYDYDYDYEENGIDFTDSSLELSEEQLKIISKIFPPFEIHREKTRTYKYVNRMHNPECVDNYLFATLLKFLLIQNEKLNNKNTIYGKKESKEYLNKIIIAYQFIVKYNK